MSLLDAFLEDALPASVLAKSDVWFAIRKDGAVGLGTREDPFDGSTAAHFDNAMANLVDDHTTIHLGPGEFKTQGGSVWQPQSGQRIVGAGIDATTLKVENVSQNIDISAVGKPVPDVFLEGFEMSDLTIDCNLDGAGSGSGIGGISVTGNHVYLHRLRVIHFGRKSDAGLCVGLSAAWARPADEVEQEDAFAPQDCVIEACLVTPDEASVEGATLVALRLGSAGSDAPSHIGCVIRNCHVDGAVDGAEADFDRDIRGMVASGGIGTIVEGNHVRNCRHGGPCQTSDETVSTQDLIVRDNVYARVQYGISMELGSSQTVGRIVALNNWIELGTDQETPWNIWGIQLKRSSGYGFVNIVLRGNVIRCDGAQYDPGDDYGIQLQGCTHAIVESNLVDVETENNAVSHQSTDGVKPFNNQTAEGEFRPGYDGTLHDQELTTEVEDVLLGLVMNGRS